MFGEPTDYALFLVIPSWARYLFPEPDGLWEELRVGDEIVLYFSHSKNGKEIHKALLNECIPFNELYFQHIEDFWPAVNQSIRFDSDGTKKVFTKLQAWAAETAEVYDKLLSRFIPLARQRKRATMALLCNNDWFNQEHNATLHRTRKLLGDPDCGA